MRCTRITNQTLHGDKDWDGSKHFRNTETLTELTVSQKISSGTFSQDSVRCSSIKKAKVDCPSYEKHQKISMEEFYWCRCSTTFLVEQNTMKKNVWQNPNSYLCAREDLEKQWSSIRICSKKKVVLYQWRQSTRNQWQYCKKDADGIRWERMSNFPCCDSILPEINSSKRQGKLSIHHAADQKTIETISRIIVSANQLNHYEAVAEICEEYESLHERMGRPFVMGRSSSSLVFSVIKTENFLRPANLKFLLQHYGKRIEKLSQQNK